jgi:Ca2+-binding RTX toxin-like protein
LWGGGGATFRLYGGDGDDTLFGNEQSDSLSGGEGDDVLTGGAGGDRFVLSSGAVGFDHVTDFSGTDKVDLVGVAVLAGFGTSEVTVGIPTGFSILVLGSLEADNGHLWAPGDFV